MLQPSGLIQTATRSAILILAAAALFGPDPAGQLGIFILAGGTLATIFFEKYLPSWLNLVTSLSMLVVVFVSSRNYFADLTWLDDLLHFAVPFLIGLNAAFYLLRRLRGLPKSQITALALSVVLAIASLWEIFEWLTRQQIAEAGYSLTLDDTILDLILALAGGSLSSGLVCLIVPDKPR